MLKLVPFNPAWITHDKIDIKGIYRRPRFVSDEYGELERELDASGLPTWDITSGLPIKQHNKWTQKGFEFVTLADADSLVTAARFGTIPGDWKEYNQHQTGGPWNYKKYMHGQQQTTTRDAEHLIADIEQFGSAAVEAIRRRSDPAFTLPERMRNVQPGGKVPEPPKPAAKVDAKADDKKKQGAAA